MTARKVDAPELTHDRCVDRRTKRLWLAVGKITVVMSKFVFADLENYGLCNEKKDEDQSFISIFIHCSVMEQSSKDFGTITYQQTVILFSPSS